MAHYSLPCFGFLSIPVFVWTIILRFPLSSILARILASILASILACILACILTGFHFGLFVSRLVCV
jgi:hypothetical protein